MNVENLTMNEVVMVSRKFGHASLQIKKKLKLRTDHGEKFKTSQLKYQQAQYIWVEMIEARIVTLN